MSLSLVLPSGGLSGWSFLKRSGAVQRQIVARDPIVARNTEYFRENIGKIKSADDLVKDYRLLSVALGAFGLEGEVANKAFIRKVLESDGDDKQSFVSRMSDKRFAQLAAAFKLDDGTGAVTAAGFGDRLAAQFTEREFERRVGESQNDLRLAMNAQRELASMAKRTSSERTLWYEVMGSPPLRKVFETALGIGKEFAKLPIDRQLQEFMSRADSVLGTTSFKGYATQEGSEKLIRTFLVRSEIATTAPAQTSYSAALTLLRR